MTFLFNKIKYYFYEHNGTFTVFLTVFLLAFSYFLVLLGIDIISLLNFNLSHLSNADYKFVNVLFLTLIFISCLFLFIVFKILFYFVLLIIEENNENKNK